jgi:hypothetical protein
MGVTTFDVNPPPVGSPCSRDPEIDSPRITDDEMGRKHEEGWMWYLEALGQRFEKVATR